MGRGKKIRAGKGDAVSLGAPLDQQLYKAQVAKERAEPRQKQKRKVNDEGESSGPTFIDNDLSARILAAARRQRNEEENDEEETETGTTNAKEARAKRLRQISLGASSMPDDSDREEEEEGEDNVPYDDRIITLDPQEEDELRRFTRDGGAKTKTLFDVIQGKINEKRAEVDAVLSQFDPNDAQVRDMHPDVTAMYEEIGGLLAKYRSGKLPKAFKLVPQLVNWEQVLYLMKPEGWSAAAMYEATRLFASNLNPRMCQRFYNLVLLPRLRDDIDEYKKLNVHLFEALKKALYKPAAFFKGILLPLCESGTCTLREATIFGSVLSRSHIPILHAAVAMTKIAQMDYSGANSYFLRVFIEKKYALPYPTIDALHKHFVRFGSDSRQLPVLWHSALLAFCTRYKSDLSATQRKTIYDLLQTHCHHQIGEAIRCELAHAEREEEEGKKRKVDQEMVEVALPQGNPLKPKSKPRNDFGMEF